MTGFANEKSAKTFARQAKKNYVDVEEGWSSRAAPISVPVSRDRMINLIEEFFTDCNMELDSIDAVTMDDGVHWSVYRSPE